MDRQIGAEEISQIPHSKVLSQNNSTFIMRSNSTLLNYNNRDGGRPRTPIMLKVPREKAQSEERSTDRRKVYNYSVKNMPPKIIQTT